MAELLIRPVNNFHADPVKDRRGSYKRGDPVVVMPDGHKWGREERLPHFWRIAVRGASVQVMRPFCQELYDGIWTPDKGARALLRRRWKLAPEMLLAAHRMALYRGDIVECSWDTWLRCTHDKGAAKFSRIILAA